MQTKDGQVTYLEAVSQALLFATFPVQVLMLDNLHHGRPAEDIQWLLDAAA